MRALKFLLLAVMISLGAFADDKACDYNEFKGKVVLRYEAHNPRQARGWAPTHLVLCKDSEGLYAIVTHQAIGLGFLSNPPLRIPKKPEDWKSDKSYARLVNQSTSYDEREAYKLFDDKSLEAVIVFTGTKEQVLVIRKELFQVVSNTLFLQEEGAHKD